MSMLIYGSTQTKITLDRSNWFLSHFQVAMQRRFAEGLGFFFTMAGKNDDDEDISVSYWMHPAIPYLFVFDVESDTGEPVEVVTVEERHVQALLDAMDRPGGVLWGFYSESGDHKPRPYQLADPNTDEPTTGPDNAETER